MNHIPFPLFSTKKLMLRGPPAPLSGPPHLQALAGDCFKTKFKKYALKG